MALTATGIGSGLDIKGLVAQIMQLERRPLERLDQQKSQFDTRISAFGQLKSSLSQLQTAVDALKKTETFSAAKATVAAGADFTATAKPGATAGTYDISVQQLALQQRVATSATTQFDPSGGGTLDITVGSNTVSLNVAAGTTLQQLRDQINAANAGVTAAIINNGGVNQLVISSKETGAANAFTLNGTGALAGLSFSNPNSLPTNSSSPIYRLQSAQDAQLTINGVQITRSKNTITDAIDNVTLQLNAANNTTRSVTIERDLAPAKKEIKKMVDAYNAVMDRIDTLGGYDAEKKKAGDLYGDASLRGLRNQLRSAFGDALTGVGAFNRLQDFGVEFDVKGRMKVIDTKLTQALETQFNDVASFFAGVGSNNGLVSRAGNLIQNYTKTSGLIDLRVNGLQQSIKLLDKQKEALENRLFRLQDMYLRQFNAMDSIVGQMNATSTYLSQQLAGLLRQGNN